MKLLTAGKYLEATFSQKTPINYGKPWFQIFRNENEFPVRPGFDVLEYFRKFYYKRENNPWKDTTGLITEYVFSFMLEI